MSMRAWSCSEDAALRHACASGEPAAVVLAKQIGRSRADVRERVRTLGLTWSRVGTGHRWTEAEDVIVRAGVRAGRRPTEIARSLPGRSPAAIGVRGHALGLAVHGRRWRPVDDYRLRVAVEAGDSIDRIAADLERTREAIRHRCRDLRIGQPRAARDARAYQRWDATDEARLHDLRGLTLQEIARRIGRSEAVVRRRLLRLGIAQPRRGRFVPNARGGFSQSEDRLLAEALLAGRPLAPLARRLGRDVHDIELRARSLEGSLDILRGEAIPQPAPRRRRALVS